MNTIRTLVIQFANTLSAKEIPLFRGAVIQSMEESNILFHNHTPDGFRYSYPLIQYKRIKGKAAIVCMGEGTEAIGKLLANKVTTLQIGEKQVQMEIEHMSAYQTIVACEDTIFHYSLRNWIPLNSTNYAAYSSTDSLASHIEMLEKILVGNIMSFLKGMGIQMEDQVKVFITSVENKHLAQYKGVAMTCFNIKFNTNLRLPYLIGLGKGTSLGFGTIQTPSTKQHE